MSTSVRFLRQGLLGMLFAVATAAPGFGSSISATAICAESNVVHDTHVSTTPGVAAHAELDHCSASAYADWSVLRVGGSTNLLQMASPQFQTSNSMAEWILYFSLVDPTLPASYARAFNLPIEYDATLAANEAGFAGVASVANFGVHVYNDPYTIPVNFATGYDPYSNNNCPSPLTTIPRCNGHYVGTASYPVTFYYNTPFLNRLTISTNAQTLDALVDAMHSVSIGPIVLDPSTSFVYDDPSIGNPLNFRVAAPPSVPEPAMVTLLAPALVGLGLVRRRRQASSLALEERARGARANHRPKRVRRRSPAGLLGAPPYPRDVR